MKTLLLLRHGKSSWSDTSLADHDRPLKKRGRAAAKRMGQLIRELDLIPEHILTSSAVRATATAQLAAAEAKFDGAVEVIPVLYHADPSAFVAIVSRVPNQFERVLVVGHNPGMEDWLDRLIGHVETFPTAALAQIELLVDSWLDLSTDTRGKLQGLWRPKEIA